MPSAEVEPELSEQQPAVETSFSPPLVGVISQNMFDITHPWESHKYTWQVAVGGEGRGWGWDGDGMVGGAALELSADHQRKQRETQREEPWTVDLRLLRHPASVVLTWHRRSTLLLYTVSILWSDLRQRHETCLLEILTGFIPPRTGTFKLLYVIWWHCFYCYWSRPRKAI